MYRGQKNIKIWCDGEMEKEKNKKETVVSELRKQFENIVKI